MSYLGLYYLTACVLQNPRAEKTANYRVARET